MWTGIYLSILITFSVFAPHCFSCRPLAVSVLVLEKRPYYMHLACVLRGNNIMCVLGIWLFVLKNNWCTWLIMCIKSNYVFCIIRRSSFVGIFQLNVFVARINLVFNYYFWWFAGCTPTVVIVYSNRSDSIVASWLLTGFKSCWRLACCAFTRTIVHAGYMSMLLLILHYLLKPSCA